MSNSTVIAAVLVVALLPLIALLSVAYVVRFIFKVMQSDWQEYLGNDPKLKK